MLGMPHPQGTPTLDNSEPLMHLKFHDGVFLNTGTSRDVSSGRTPSHIFLISVGALPVNRETGLTPWGTEDLLMGPSWGEVLGSPAGEARAGLCPSPAVLSQ